MGAAHESPTDTAIQDYETKRNSKKTHWKWKAIKDLTLRKNKLAKSLSELNWAHGESARSPFFFALGAAQSWRPGGEEAATIGGGRSPCLEKRALPGGLGDALRRRRRVDLVLASAKRRWRRGVLARRVWEEDDEEEMSLSMERGRGGGGGGERKEREVDGEKWFA